LTCCLLLLLNRNFGLATRRDALLGLATLLRVEHWRRRATLTGARVTGTPSWLPDGWTVDDSRVVKVTP
jgi:hypothetical protein